MIRDDDGRPYDPRDDDYPPGWREREDIEGWFYSQRQARRDTIAGYAIWAGVALAAFAAGIFVGLAW